MNQRPVPTKLPASLQKRRKRRNSKYERCKAAIKEEMNMSTEASDLAMLATHQNKVWLLKPFNSNFSREDYQRNLRLQTEQYDRNDQREDGARRLKTEHDQYRSAKRQSVQPVWSNMEIQRSLGQIMNPQEKQSSTKKYQGSTRPPTKQYQDIIFDEHISEFSRAKEEEHAFRRRISTRFAEKYPNRVKTEPDFIQDEVAARESNDKRTDGMVTPRNTESRSSNNKRWTSFYSRSKKRCMMERYIPPEPAEQEQRVMPTVTFMEYLWDKNIRKSLSQVSRKNRCEHLARSKQKILSIEKPGSKKQLRLRECLDKILIDSINS